MLCCFDLGISWIACCCLSSTATECAGSNMTVCKHGDHQQCLNITRIPFSISHNFCKCSLDFSENCMTNFIMINWKGYIKIAISASTLPKQAEFAYCYCLPQSLPFYCIFNELQNYLSFVLGIHLGKEFLNGCVNRTNAQQ